MVLGLEEEASLAVELGLVVVSAEGVVVVVVALFELMPCEEFPQALLLVGEKEVVGLVLVAEALVRVYESFPIL